ncbi:MAG: hypothetical protein H7233_03335, partial [Pseudorhodobacter sp.]|nr:hypothetical protein [Frankiaceae bacterium]
MTIADDDTELVLADELSAAAESVRGRDDRAHTFRRYADWCATRELIALPITEQNLLRFLHDHHPGWSWGYAKNLTSRLDAYARLGQQPSPRGPRVVGYLRRLKRELGTRPQQLVEACRVEEARRLTDVLHAPASDDAAAKILRVRAAIVIAAASGLNLAGTGRRQPRESDSPTFAADLTHAQLHVHADRVLIGLDPSLPLGVVHRGQDPLGFRLLTEHLAATADRRWPLLTEQPQPHRGLIRRVSSALVAAGLPAAARTSLAGLSWAERDWLLAHADRKVGATRRNHAYLLGGLGAGLRHASLALLRL